MRHPHRSVVLALSASLLAAATVRAVGDATVTGSVEGRISAKIASAIAAENLANEASELLDVDGARRHIDTALGLLGEALTDLTTTPDGVLHPSTDRQTAFENLNKARKKDEKALDASLTRLSNLVLKANRNKALALLALRGQSQPSDEQIDRVLQMPAQDAYFEPFEMPTTRLARGSSWTFDLNGDARFQIRVDRWDLAAGGKRASRDHYLSFRAKSKKATTAAFGFTSIPRDLVGPFRAEITAGVFEPNDANLAAQGSAFTCIELDVKGSSPLEYVAACARYTEGGILAFANRTSQVALGQAHFPGATRVRLRMDYDGTTVRVFAKPDGAPDDAFVSIGQFDRPQGDDTWVAGVGAAQLVGKATVGVDDLEISVLE